MNTNSFWIEVIKEQLLMQDNKGASSVLYAVSMMLEEAGYTSAGYEIGKLSNELFDMGGN